MSAMLCPICGTHHYPSAGCRPFPVDPTEVERLRRDVARMVHELDRIFKALNPECPSHPGVPNGCHVDACDCFGDTDMPGQVTALRAEVARLRGDLRLSEQQCSALLNEAGAYRDQIATLRAEVERLTNLWAEANNNRLKAEAEVAQLKADRDKVLRWESIAKQSTESLIAYKKDADLLDWLADVSDVEYERAMDAIRNSDPGDRAGLRAALDAARKDTTA